jgi:hypothetical protein
MGAVIQSHPMQAQRVAFFMRSVDKGLGVFTSFQILEKTIQWAH